MALLQCRIFSHALTVATEVQVIMPQGRPGPHPVLYLLHGYSDDQSIWCRRTSIERYADAKGIAVIMPGVGHSFYSDMVYGSKYWTYVSEELPQIMQEMFAISSKREHTFVAGLSMGGYGAFKLALSHPDRFAAAASLSGVMDVARLCNEDAFKPAMQLCFGDITTLPGSHNDLFALADSVASQGDQPLLYQCCGTEDFLYADNIRFRDHAQTRGLTLTYEEGPGTHEWGYWDAGIRRVLEWLPLP